MHWIELLLAVVGGALLGVSLLVARSIVPGATGVIAWVLAALAAMVATMLWAAEPLVSVVVGLAAALVVVVAGAPWAMARADPHLAALPYWSRLRGDARLRADVLRSDARGEHVVPEHRDLSTPEG